MANHGTDFSILGRVREGLGILPVNSLGCSFKGPYLPLVCPYMPFLSLQGWGWCFCNFFSKVSRWDACCATGFRVCSRQLLCQPKQTAGVQEHVKSLYYWWCRFEAMGAERLPLTQTSQLPRLPTAERALDICLLWLKVGLSDAYQKLPDRGCWQELKCLTNRQCRRLSGQIAGD